MIQLEVRTAALRRPLSPGQTRLVVRATDERGTPVAIFLCCVEPPNTFERRMRESFQTVCSVEDMTEYPVGVSSVQTVDPTDLADGTLLYAAQENLIYEKKQEMTGTAIWRLYRPVPSGVIPNVHTHKLPFFRRSTIDIILPNRAFVTDAVRWIEEAAMRLEKDQLDLDDLKPYQP